MPERNSSPLALECYNINRGCPILLTRHGDHKLVSIHPAELCHASHGFQGQLKSEPIIHDIVVCAVFTEPLKHTLSGFGIRILLRGTTAIQSCMVDCPLLQELRSHPRSCLHGYHEPSSVLHFSCVLQQRLAVFPYLCHCKSNSKSWARRSQAPLWGLACYHSQVEQGGPRKKGPHCF